jgi:phosphoserine phosphatase
MPLVALVLTSSPAAPALSALTVERCLDAIGREAVRQTRWLAPVEAWEATFTATNPHIAMAVRDAMRATLNGLSIDVNVVSAEPDERRKRLLVADMESTIIEQECLDELAERVGLRPRIAAITERAMRGELDFEAAIKERVGLLAGLDASVLQEIYDARVTLMPGADRLVATMRRAGAFCALVSGGFSFFTERIAAQLGFGDQQANRLDIAAGKLTGRVLEPILGREAKLAALERYSAGLGLTASAALAVGDGANDLAMIKAAGLGVAFRAKPIVAAEAAVSIRHGDLTSLLFLQGYPVEEHVHAASPD